MSRSFKRHVNIIHCIRSIKGYKEINFINHCIHNTDGYVFPVTAIYVNTEHKVRPQEYD